MKQTPLLLLRSLALLALAAGLPAIAAPSEASLSLVPAAGDFEVGQTFVVEVWLEDVADLYAADVQLSFDQSRLRVLDADSLRSDIQVEPGDLLWPDFVVENMADNDAGTIHYAFTQLNPSEPVSGSGILFRFTLEALATGEAGIAFADQILSTRDGEAIVIITGDSVYQLTGPSDLYYLFLPLVKRGT